MVVNCCAIYPFIQDVKQIMGQYYDSHQKYSQYVLINKKA